MAADGRRALAIKPKLFACLGRHRHKAFTAACIGKAHDLTRRPRYGVSVITSDVAKEHHLGQAAALALGGVSHGLEVAIVQMLKPGQHHAARRASKSKKVVLDINDRWHRILGMAKEFKTHRAGMGWHFVQHPARARDQTITAFFLYARQAG